MITFRKVTELSLNEIVELWNRGFEGYFVPISMSVDAFISRAGSQELSLEHSWVACVDDVPASLVLNGLRSSQGVKTAWNGGTCTRPEFRGQGVGKALMEHNLEYYREQGVQVATLEAFAQNVQAIKLYESVGYEFIDRLLFLQHTETLRPDAFPVSNSASWTIAKGLPREAASVPFYPNMTPWQTQWQSIKEGEVLMVLDDERHECIGYSLYKRLYDHQGNLTTIMLFQCEADPEREEAAAIVNHLLNHTMAPLEASCKRTTFNLPQSNKLVVEALKQAGFTDSTELVFMIKNMASH